MILIEPVREKREIAKKLGADLCIDPVNEDVEKALAEHGVDRIATVIECVGKVATMEMAVRIAGNKSLVMLFGLTAPNDQMTVKPFELFKKEITLMASFINPSTQKRVLTMIESGNVDVSSIVYGCEPLDRLPGILSSAELRAKGKYVILPQK